MAPGQDQPELVDLVSDSESDEEVLDHLSSLGNEPLHSSIITSSHADPMSAMRRLFPTVRDLENNQHIGDRSSRPLLSDDHGMSEDDLRGVSSGSGGNAACTVAPERDGIAAPQTQKNPVIMDILDDEDSSGSHTATGSDGGRKRVRVLPGSNLTSESDQRLQRSREEDGVHTKHTTTVDLSQLSDEDDEDWRRAVQLSLQDSAARTAANISPSGLNSDPDTEGEDEDLRKAIALSLLETNAVSDSNGSPSSSSSSQAKGNGQSGTMTTKPEGRLDKSEDTKPHGINANGELKKEPRMAETTLSDTLATSTPELDFTVGSTSTNLNGNVSREQSTFSILALNRKQMEEERLARLKRKREGDMDGVSDKGSKTLRLDQTASSARSTKEISPPPLQRKAQRTGTQETSTSSVADANRNTGGQGKSSTSASVRSCSSAPSSTSQLFPMGKILKTTLADSGSVSSNDTISFAQLISPSTPLESALLSSFIWDFDWLFPHFDTKRTKFQLVMHGKSASQRTSILSEFSGVNNVRITFPPMEGITNCMHSKLMLLFYCDEDAPQLGVAAGEVTCWSGETKQAWSKRCRVVIPTANLVGFDWGVGSFMENTVFLLDLPSKSSSTTFNTSREQNVGVETETATQFETSLRAFLKAQTVPEDVLTKLSNFDFSLTSPLAFVHTLGGAHTNPQIIQSTGLPGLANAVTQLGLATRRELQLDYVTSSLGNLNEIFMRNVYNAAQGDSSACGLAAALAAPSSSSTSRSEPRKTAGLPHARGKKEGDGDGDEEVWQKNFRIYYPSDATVRNSRGGMHNAGTICFSSKWWAQQSFPQSNMRDCISLREGLLMHNKVSTIQDAPG
ncbi:hypothetical protein RBB50_008122 [Rhinocladiella similis]